MFSAAKVLNPSSTPREKEKDRKEGEDGVKGSKIDREGGGKGKGEEERVGRWETLCHQRWAIFPRSLGSQLLLLISHYVAEGTAKIRVML